MSAKGEEMSAQAQELAATAEQLTSLIGRFKLEQAQHPACQSGAVAPRRLTRLGSDRSGCLPTSARTLPIPAPQLLPPSTWEVPFKT
jgi:hypothetical protein